MEWWSVCLKSICMRDWEVSPCLKEESNRPVCLETVSRLSVGGAAQICGWMIFASWIGLLVLCPLFAQVIYNQIQHGKVVEAANKKNRHFYKRFLKTLRFKEIHWLSTLETKYHIKRKRCPHTSAKEWQLSSSTWLSLAGRSSGGRTTGLQLEAAGVGEVVWTDL